MCGFLDEIEMLPTDARAVLRDRTGSLLFFVSILLGSIGCTIHRGVIRKYKDLLSSRVLVIIKQVS